MVESYTVNFTTKTEKAKIGQTAYPIQMLLLNYGYSSKRKLRTLFVHIMPLQLSLIVQFIQFI